MATEDKNTGAGQTILDAANYMVGQNGGSARPLPTYDAVPAGVGKVKGTPIGPNHNDVTGQPDCRQAAFPCVNGVYGYLGYPTAWLMYQLQGDSYAHGAFVSGTGEMFLETKNWEIVASNIP